MICVCDCVVLMCGVGNLLECDVLCDGVCVCVVDDVCGVCVGVVCVVGVVMCVECGCEGGIDEMCWRFVCVWKIVCCCVVGWCCVCVGCGYG